MSLCTSIDVPVEFVVANNRDVLTAPEGTRIPEGVPRVRLSGVVDTGATRLVLPEKAVACLHLAPAGTVLAKYADERTERRPRVANVWLKLLGRESVFNAILEPDRTDALIGAIVLEDLDLPVDCVTQRLHPRDPKETISEIE
jgi:predicted aspartyl protease